MFACLLLLADLRDAASCMAGSNGEEILTACVPAIYALALPSCCSGLWILQLLLCHACTLCLITMLCHPSSRQFHTTSTAGLPSLPCLYTFTSPVPRLSRGLHMRFYRFGRRLAQQHERGIRRAVHARSATAASAAYGDMFRWFRRHPFSASPFFGW